MFPAHEYNHSPVIDLYCRVSTDEQADRGSIGNQTHFFARWCELHNFTPGTIYADDGVSGTIPLPARPAGSALLTAATANKAAPQLAVYRLDRIGRDPKVILDAVAALEKNGIVLRSMTEPFDTITPAGRLLLNMLAGFAGFERESTLARSAEGIRRRIREGGYIGHTNCYYGYKLVGQKSTTHLEFSGAWVGPLGMTEARAAAYIFEQIAGGRTAHELGQHFAALGVPAPSSRAAVNGFAELSPDVWKYNIARMIHYPIYKGAYIFHQSKSKKGTLPSTSFEVDVPHLALVSADLWQAANDALLRNRKLSTKNAVRRYLLRGLIRCAHCGAAYSGYTFTGYHDIADTTHNAQGVGYRCNTKNGKKGANACIGKAIGGNIEIRVWNQIRGFLLNPGIIAPLDDFVPTSVSPSNAYENEQKQLALAIGEKQNERDRVSAAFRKGIFTLSEMDQQREAIKKEEALLQLRLDVLNKEAAQTTNREAQLQNARTVLETMAHFAMVPVPSWEIRRQLVELLVESIAVHTLEFEEEARTEARIVYRFPLPESDVPPLLVTKVCGS